MTKDTQQYDAKQIEVLEGLAPVRKRPMMYISDIHSGKGLHHLIWEVVDNCTDEHMAGYCSKIDVTLLADGGVRVSDNGRGIPVDEHPTKKRPALEVVMTVLHAGGKFGKGVYQVSGGLHGVGLSVVNALSKELNVTVARDGYEWNQQYRQGVPQNDLQKGKKTKNTGTTIEFWPDPEIFNKTDFNIDVVIKRMRETAFLNPALTINVHNEVTGESTNLNFKGGLIEYMQYLNEDEESIFPDKPIYFEGKCDDVEIAVALQYTDQNKDTILSYCNTVATVDGGRHERGLKSSFTRVMKAFARDQKILKTKKDDDVSGDDIRDGMVGIIAVKVIDPLFMGQVKSQLGNEDVETAVSKFIGEKLTEYLDKNTNVGRRIIDRALIAKRARDAAKNAANAIKKKSIGVGIADKLAKCRSKKPEECELFIVEGDSAAGPAVNIRDSQTQAILPLRGKIRNALKDRVDQLIKNQEIQTIIHALGVGVETFTANGNNSDDDEAKLDLDKLNYHKVILLTDSDHDGMHIQGLLLTLFFAYFKPLVDAGYLYIAKPPLFKVAVGKNKYYAQDEDELEILLKKYKNGKITRYKGLGEMNDDELGETAINPSTRNIVKVDIESFADAKKMFNNLMGKSSQPRKEYLMKNAGEYFSKIFENSII